MPYVIVRGLLYATYNHVRPHSYNGYQTPYQTRMSYFVEASACPGIGLVDQPKSETAVFVKNEAA